MFNYENEVIPEVLKVETTPPWPLTPVVKTTPLAQTTPLPQYTPKTYNQYFSLQTQANLDPNFTLNNPEIPEKWKNKFKRQTDNLAITGNRWGISKGAQNLMSVGSAMLGSYANQDLSETSKLIDSGLSLGLNMIGPAGIGIDFARKGVGALLKAADLNIDKIDKNIWKRQGLSGASRIGNEIAASLGFVPGITKTGNAINIENSARSGFGGTARNADDMAAMSGKNLLFGGKDVNGRMKEVNLETSRANVVAKDQKKMESDYLANMQAINIQNAYRGYTPGNSMPVRKTGGVIPELEEVRNVIHSLQSKKQENQETQKFQLGGKMNMIVTGALHARKHNLEELNPNLDGEITKKGIPVVIMNDGGEVVNQTAEVETHEIILASNTTKTVEDYYHDYNSNDSKAEKNKIALECGKYLVDELLKNTDDPDKVIKKTI